jgi:hypothetical protein
MCEADKRRPEHALDQARIMRLPSREHIEASGRAIRPMRCRLCCRLTPTFSGIAKGEQRQITPSVNDLQISCGTFYSPAVA